ncbi:MAG TPA: phytoene/squalene synthase family protein [Candidatus Paceibacterota bacterium]|nr:phytoene/squalene synthase family protein [Verrucomicrobiota bacterium]HSA09010.1 phytoene/squalene synthase family protein [Candidatus Paceibacterota bacterium]
MAQAPEELLTGLLRDVSRSFYLTLRVLPGGIRTPVSLAYLLARTADTIADTELVALEQRLEALRALRERIQGRATAKLDFGALARQQGSRAEGILLERCEASLALLQGLQPGDRQLVREVLEIITSGQELDLRRFAGASAGSLVALRADAELDDYTYRVAGCVGEFWTRICRAHVFPRASVDDALLLANSVRFGKGLQLVNILRDVAADLRQGRCYIPAEKLAVSGLKPGDLLLPESEPRFRPLYHEYLARADAHLRAGWDYIHALPRRCVRVRLACAWPILIGRETLERLRDDNVLDPALRVKVSRRQVRKIIFRSVLLYPWPGAWEKMFPVGKPVASPPNLP